MADMIYDGENPNDPAVMEKIHKINKDMLDTLDAICKKHGIRYYIAYGTLLSALRYEDFIPWDNDVDVMILREDLPKLLSVLPKELDPEKYFLVTPGMYGKHYRDIVPFMAYKKAHIRLDPKINAYYNDLCDLITLDFFILDKVPDNFRGKLLQYRLEFRVALANAHRQETNYGAYKGIMKAAAWVLNIAGKMFSADRMRKSIDRLAQKYNSDPSVTTYAVTNDNRSSYSYRLPVSDFEEGKRMKLGDGMYLAPKNPVNSMTQYYGKDYMTPPPYEKRVMHLGFMNTTGDDTLRCEDFTFEE